jgi:hypothetical protein
LKVAYATKILFSFAANATVLSLLAFYYRLIGDTNIRWFRWTLHLAVVFNIIAWLPFVLAMAFSCTPVKAYWSFPPPVGSHCINEGASTLAGGCAKTFVDLLVTTLPIPLIMRMKMTKKQKYGICILLGFGYIVTAAGALRTYYSYKLFYGGSYDQTWDQYPAFIASAVENDLGVVS